MKRENVFTPYTNLFRDTDIAAERLRAEINVPGVSYHRTLKYGRTISTLTIEDARGAIEIGKDIGTYITIDYPPAFAETLDTPDILAELVSPLLPAPSKSPLLIIGVGNGEILPDSVGPRTAMNITATAHKTPNGVAVLSPGTESTTGIPLPQLVEACVKSLTPRAVIAVDALTTCSPTRLLSTIQITDAGITPGSGIRAGRAVLNRSSLGCPVVAIGVPTIISSHAFNTTGRHKSSPNTDTPPLYLTPCDAEVGIERAAVLIAQAINHITGEF